MTTPPPPEELDLTHQQPQQRLRRWGKALALLCAGMVLGALLLSLRKSAPTPAADEHTGHAHSQEQAGALWTCSMHPQVQSQEPGLCPICGMDLIQASSVEGSAAEPMAGQIMLGERAKKLARLRTAEVSTLALDGQTRELLGRVSEDEEGASVVTSWVGGRIEKLYTRVTGEQLKRGQAVASIYSPEVYATHRELLAAISQLERLGEAPQLARSTARGQLEAARQKLRLMGISSSELAKMERAEKAWTRLTIRSTTSGTILERLVSQGNYIKVGEPLLRVASLDEVWVLLDAYESDLGQVSVGQSVKLSVSAYPERTFTGEISFIEPTLDARTRTTPLRVVVKNEEGLLKPGMYARATLEAQLVAPGAAIPLAIPASAPLFAGERALVYVEKQSVEEGSIYEGRMVKLGERVQGMYPVLAGLSLGERVVTHGAFVLDSDLQIRGGLSLMARPDDTQSSPLDDVRSLQPASLTALSPLLRGYLDVQELLAQDDLKGAKKRASDWKGDLEGIALGEENGEVQRTWQELQRRLLAGASQISEAQTLEAARGHFLALTGAVSEVLRRFGNPADVKVRLAYCPMAFDSRGGHWFQRAEVVDNVYYGESMRQCGEIQETLSPGEFLVRGGEQ